jgi:hypothetical protein
MHVRAQWQCLLESPRGVSDVQVWADYATEYNNSIERAWQAAAYGRSGSPYFVYQRKSFKWKVDTLNCVQINLSTGTRRPIRRSLVPEECMSGYNLAIENIQVQARDPVSADWGRAAPRHHPYQTNGRRGGWQWFPAVTAEDIGAGEDAHASQSRNGDREIHRRWPCHRGMPGECAREPEVDDARRSSCGTLLAGWIPTTSNTGELNNQAALRNSARPPARLVCYTAPMVDAPTNSSCNYDPWADTEVNRPTDRWPLDERQQSQPIPPRPDCPAESVDDAASRRARDYDGWEKVPLCEA